MLNDRTWILALLVVILSGANRSLAPCRCPTEGNKTNCHCEGTFEDLPVLTHDLYSLLFPLLVQFSRSVTNGKLHGLTRSEMDPFKATLTELAISKMKSFTFIQSGVFADFPELKIIRIFYTSLTRVPVMKRLGTTCPLILVDFESNKIQAIRSNNIAIRAEQLVLDYNEVETLEGWAFNGSEIGKISLKGNIKLKDISPDAFSGLKNLRDLDLSETSITYLPSSGLIELETLRLFNTVSLKTVPSIYDLANLREAWLTHSFHCCAFHHPEKHNPIRHEEYLRHRKEHCKDYDRSRNERDMYDEFGLFEDDWGNGSLSDNASSNDGFSAEGFHNASATVPDHPVQAMCGKLTERPPVNCWPQPDALNPCEDMLSWSWLRASVWIVLSTAIIGNTSVLVVLSLSRTEMSVARFLMCHLAFADFCMAIYLLLLAIMDLISTEVYFNYAYDWQRGVGCKIAGFLTVFSTQLSLFSLSLLTLERWFAIRHALYTNLLDLTIATKVTVGGWGFSFLMGILPLFGISSYSSTSICLPMDIHNWISLVYVLVLLFSAGLAFLLMCVCYAQIYLSLSFETRNSRGESSVAKKMLVLVATNFICWAPIAFFALTALIGHPLINVTQSKILLVFIYPINSCANPYLYAIMTKQYRKDFIMIMSRCGLCKKCAREYTLVYSRPNTSNQHQVTVESQM